MNLEKLSDEEIDLVVGVPYKVGMWVSYIDDQDGEGDDRREQKALIAALKHLSKLYKEDPMMAALLKETLLRENKWAEWADQSFEVINDIRQAVLILRQKGYGEQLKNYKRSLMEIASAVAQASNEFGAFDEAQTEGFLGRIMDKFAALGEGDSGHPMNVSAAEDSALEKLRSVLREKA